MRTARRFPLLALAVILPLLGGQVEVARSQSGEGLQVTAKTASSIALSWSNWTILASVQPSSFAVFRDGKQHTTVAPSQRTYRDNSVGWGRTFAYFIRLVTTSGQTFDTNTAVVTTDAVPSGVNIVLVVTDDQRYDTLQYMPYVQQLLVQQGITFGRAFASTPQCCPSRAGILTGLVSHHHGVLSNRDGARAFDDTSTVATWLQAAEYRTALIGKYLNGYADSNCQLYGQCFKNVTGVHPWPYVPPGWNDWHAFGRVGYYNYTLVENGSEVSYGSTEAEYSTTVLAAKAVDFIQTTAVGQPFFLYFAPYAPHGRGEPAKSDRGLYAGIAPWRPPSWNEADVSDKPAWVQALPLLDEAAINEIDTLRRNQLESLQAVDRAVKAIVDAVTATGRLESTVFIFTSDNGQSWGEHRWDAKMCPYEECVRVPLVIRVPGVPARSEPHLMTLLDLAPSIASWAGVLHASRMDGLSLARLAAMPNTPWRNDLLIEMLGGEPGQDAMLYSAVRTKGNLYVEFLNGDRELYDLGADPYELTNRADSPEKAHLLAALKARLAILRGQ